jgi:DNA-binding GntR family transcriptional regulator
VYRVRGRGTFASPGSRDGRYLHSVGTIDDLLALALDTTLETIRPFARSANVEVASRLQLPSDVVAAGLFRRRHEGTPYCVLQVYLPPQLADRVVARKALPEPGEARAITVIRVLEDAEPELIAMAQQSISVTAVPADIAPLIDLESRDSALRIDRIYLAFNGDPVLLAVSYFHPERYTYRLSLRRSAQPR